jgi:tetratricopeptide (TPR) repeat protein
VNYETKPAPSAEPALELLTSPGTSIRSIPSSYQTALEDDLTNVLKAQGPPQAAAIMSTIDALTRLSIAYGGGDSNTKASRCIQLALDLADDLDDQNDVNLADLRRSVGNAFRREGKYFQAITQYERALKVYQMSPGINNIQATSICKLIGDTYERRGSYQEAITSYQQALAICDNLLMDSKKASNISYYDLISQLRGAILTCISNALFQFSQTQSRENLDRALAFNQEISQSLSDVDPVRAIFLNSFVNNLMMRFDWTGSLDDLDAALGAAELVVHIIPEDHPNKALYLNNLSIVLRSRFEQTGSTEDLNRALALASAAVESIPADSPIRWLLQNNLSVSLLRRFEQIGSFRDLDEAANIAEDVVNSLPETHPNRALVLNSLSNALRIRFEQTGLLEDLDNAAKVAEQALLLIAEDHPDRMLYLNSLCNVLRKRYEQTGSLDALVQAVNAAGAAVALTPNAHPDRALYLNTLCNVLRSRFERTGSLEDLDNAVQAARAAVELIPKSHASRAIYLNSLGSVLRSLYKRTASLDDLQWAVHTAEEAVIVTSMEHSNRAMSTYLLGNLLQLRFERMGSMDDLNNAIALNEEALGLTPRNHPDHTMYLNSLGSALHTRFQRIKSTDDLDRAVAMTQQAVECSPADRPDHALYLNSLGRVLLTRFQQTLSSDVLNSAVEVNRKALKVTPYDHPNHAEASNSLATSFLSRFEMTAKMGDLDQAIKLSYEAVQGTPTGHPNRATFLYNLGKALQSRFTQTESAEDLFCAVEADEQAVEVTNAPPSIRIAAASSASRLLIGRDNQRAKSLLQVAVHLLPTINARHLKHSDQRHNIAKFADLTGLAVSLSLHCGEDPSNALQLLELGRGLLASSQLEVRSDILILQESHPEAARLFCDLRDQIDQHLNLGTEVEPVQSATTRRALVKEFDSLLKNIRCLTGFERFLLGPSATEIIALAQRGPIVVFNTSTLRSDALLVTMNTISSINLPLLKHTDLEMYTTLFLDAVSRATSIREYVQARKDFKVILEWLWDVAVGPVLDELGFTDTPVNKDWPRVWWVGCGLLTILPIHAAGYHDASPPRSAIDRVISSYTPTIKALAYAREMFIKASSSQKQKVILIGMPKTPHQQDLRFVEKEIRKLEYLLHPSVETTVLPDPTRAAVLSAIPDQQILHLSCHGFSSVDEPSQSIFLLTDWETSPLTLSDLTALKFQFPQLAFLSASETANTTDLKLLDESINPASALLLAGYPSVVGTLSKVIDEYAAEVAVNVYKHMLLGRNGLNTEKAAEGLHWAVRDLRERTRDTPFRRKINSDPFAWAVYIHLGV